MNSTASQQVLVAPPADLPQWAKQAVNLADPRIGASIHSCSDDFFAPAERMLQTTPATFIAGKYDDNGKWMDGWESRRRRHGGYDWCIIALALPGRIAQIEIDTAHFKGNYPDRVSLQAIRLAGEIDAAAIADSAQWPVLLPEQAMTADSVHTFPAPDDFGPVTHVRLNLFPDGGVSRLRLWGSAESQP